MEITLNVIWFLGVILVAIVIGYFIGRNEKVVLEQNGEAVSEGSEQSPEGFQKSVRRIFLGKQIASPVDGEVHFMCEGGRKGAVIMPQQGKIYAPASGKIIKLYPMGNAFVIRSDDQMEILIRVGRQQPDELCSMYFRCRVVQNEIVNKGKLLLEFDMEALQAAGEDVMVTVYPESGMEEGEVVLTEKENVKVGEELLKTY